MDLQQLINSWKSECDYVSIRSVDQKSRFLMARNGAHEKASLYSTNGAMIEVLIDGQFAYMATDQMTTDNLNHCFQKAKGLAKQAAKYKIATLDAGVRGNQKGSFSSDVKSTLDSQSVAEIQARLMNASKELKTDDKIINTHAYAIYSQTNTTLISSSGMEIEQKFDQMTFDLMATAQEGSESQSRSLGMMNAQAGWEKLDPDYLKKEAHRIGNEAVELLNAQECPSGEFDLLMAPDQLYLQVHESIGHPLEIDRIIGDERNYAGWSFVSPDDFGKLQYGSKLLNVTFDPSLNGELASYAFDDLGIKAQKEYIIKDGKLLRGLGSLESEKRSDIAGVASSRATSWNRPAIDRMANINIEPGTSSLDDMIAATEKGIYMQTNRSWSIDDYRNKFQFGCEYAKLIENGKITKTVKNPNYRGISTPFWNSLKMVGDASTFEVWGSFYCGKGEPNQIIRVGHAIPTCLFEKIEVFGGHQ
jgi:predicted Zn-dependent protease